MKKFLKKFSVGMFVLAQFMVFSPSITHATSPNWNVSGSYVWDVFGSYFHDINLTQNSLDGTFTGTGSWPSGGLEQTGEIITGSVTGNNIAFTVTYTGPYATGSVWNMTGTIAPDGSISGTSPWDWSFTGGVAKQDVEVSCPEGTTQSVSPMETVIVPADKSTNTMSVNPLANGMKYILKASGVANAGDGINYDARYSFRTPTSVGWTDSVSTYESYTPKLLDLLFNGSTPWGFYNGSHEYKYLATGDGSLASFLSYDVYYPNNTGNFTVDIYPCNPNTPTTGSIHGMKYNDLNRNGKKDEGEPGLAGWTIRLLLDDEVSVSGKDEFIVSAITNADGSYTFNNIAPGTYDVREVHQKGWKRMSKNPKDIVIVGGSNVTDVNFGNAVKQKKDKEDDDKDDNRDDQHGHYYGNHGHSNYDKDQDSKDHDHDDNRGGKKDH
jgi:hypothetical protein